MLLIFSWLLYYFCVVLNVGLAVGGFILSTSIYLAEITEQRIRGMLMSTTAIALGSGMLFT